MDVGGTFTDVIAVDGEGAVTFVKTASTPRDQSIGVMNALSLLAERLGLERAELLSRTERIMHGMTVATNALLERKGGPRGAADDGGAPGRARDARGPEARNATTCAFRVRILWCRATCASA